LVKNVQILAPTSHKSTISTSAELSSYVVIAAVTSQKYGYPVSID